MTVHINGEEHCITNVPRVTLHYRAGHPWLILGTPGQRGFEEIDMDDISSFWIEED